MRPSILRSLRVFLFASLFSGGLLLLLFARIVQEGPSVPLLTVLLTALWSAGLLLAALVADWRKWPWQVPAAVPIVSLLAAILWSHFDPQGHLVLSGIAPIVALMTSFALLGNRRWAWPVALASVTGFGPIVLLFAPLPEAAVVGAFALFVANAAALFLIAEDGGVARPQGA